MRPSPWQMWLKFLVNWQRSEWTHAFGRGRLMLCKLCRSKNQVRLNAELVLTSEKLKSALQDTTLYLIAKPVVCFNCGFVQLKVPKPKLRLLKENPGRKFPQRVRSQRKNARY
jgi:hypothetical protein